MGRKAVNFSDDQIIDAIKTGENREECIKQLYKKSFPGISHFIVTNSGNKQDAEDVFQDALCDLIDLIKTDRYRRQASIRTVLYSIGRNKWYEKLRERERESKPRRDIRAEQLKSLNLDIIISDEKKEKVGHIFNNLGRGCKDILSMFFFQRLSIREILQRTNYKSEEVIMTKKYNCWKKLKEEVQKLLDESDS